MSETIYFKENKDENRIYKAEWQEDYDYESPREDRDNLGTMVFMKDHNGRFGDQQVDDWGEYFLSELQKDEQIEVSGTQKLSLGGIAQNPKFEKYFESGRFDKELFTQDMDSILSNIKEELGDDVCKELSGGFSVDEDGIITDNYEIDFSAAISKRTSEDCSINGNKILDKVYNSLKENFNIYPYVSNLNVESELNSLSESQLFERWKDTKAAVLPINLYIHSGVTCSEASVRKTLSYPNNRDDGYIYNDGFVYVDKDNKEFLNELKGEARDSEGKIYNQWKPKTEDEAKKWAEGVILAEIEDYASYLEGNVHDLLVSSFDPKTLSWNEEENFTDIFGSSLEKAVKDYGYSPDYVLTKGQIQQIENSINPDFKAETARLYIEEVKENLFDFDGNIKAAATSVSKVWKATKSEISRVALNEYFKDNKLDSPEKTFSFLAEKAGLTKQEKALSPISIQDKNIKAYIATIKNPNRSDNGGLAKLLLVDEKNKSFAYFNDPSYIVSKGDIFGKVTNLGSGKHVEDKAKELARYGFKDVKKADVESEFSNVIVLYNYQTEVINSIKQAFNPVGYNAGVYGWNYDVYNINGVGFVEGYRIPNFRNSSRYSKEILNKALDKINEIRRNNRKHENISLYDYKKEQAEFLDAFKEFTDSVEQGIHDPQTIRTFADYKRELIDQKNQHPNEDLLLVAQSLSSYFANDEAKTKISDVLSKKMQKLSNISDNKQKLNAVLNNIFNEKTIKKNPERKSESYER